MRSRWIAASLVLLFVPLSTRAFAAGDRKPADKKTAAAATPTPAATPADSVSDDDLPTVGDDDAAKAPRPSGEDWDGSTRSGGMILGLRVGVHAFDPAGIAGDGGLALEGVWAMPLKGPFYLGASVGYHTGYEKAGGGGDSSTRRFFDAEFGAVEGQWRHNVGRVNVMGGVGVGFLSGNSAVITLKDGSTGSASGAGFVAHLTTGAEYQVGSDLGVAVGLKYGFAPTPFQKTGETIPMGGLTALVGFDLGF